MTDDPFAPRPFHPTLCVLPCNAWAFTAAEECWWVGMMIHDVTSTREVILHDFSITSAAGRDLLTIPLGRRQEAGTSYHWHKARPWKLREGDTIRLSLAETPKARMRLEVALWAWEDYQEPTKEERMALAMELRKKPKEG
jgi:hypothetical protein